MKDDTKVGCVGALIFLAIVGLLTLFSRPAHAEIASWYQDGEITASGAPFDPEQPVCAHRTLPFGTVLRLKRRGRVAYCIVRDRGPWIATRHLDVSRYVARRLGMIRAGVARVHVERVS